MSVWACSIGHSARIPAPAAGTIYPARPVWYRVQTGAARPASGRVCRCASCCGRSALYLARPVLPPVMCRPSGCAGWCRGTPAGYTASAQPRPVSPVTTEKIKKAQKTTTPLSSSPKISRKNKKTPTKGLCSVLYLPYKP